MTHVYCWFALALGLPLGLLDAQETPVQSAGTRVRLTAADGRERVVGTLESIDSTTIVLRRENGATVNWRREPDTRLDVSAGAGRCSGGRRGGCVILGFFGGAALGALAGLPFATGSRCNDEPCALIYFLTVPAGALVGTIVGASVGGERWKRATLPASVTVWPTGSGRFALGLSVHF